MPWIHEAKPKHECHKPDIKWWGLPNRELVSGDVWMCPGCFALFVARRDIHGRFTWRRGGFWLAWKHRKTVDSFRSGGVL